MPNIESICSEITVLSQIPASNIGEREVHRIVMESRHEPVSLPWQTPFREYWVALHNDLLIKAVHMEVLGACRWTISAPPHNKIFISEALLVGRCDTLEDAVAGAEKAVGIIFGEAA
jgi:hypothetical protein